MALCRDSVSAFDVSFDENTSKALFNLQLKQLDFLIDKQRETRTYFKKQLEDVNERFNQVFVEFEDEKRKNEHFDRIEAAESLAQLQKENQELELNVKQLSASMESERDREKLIILTLLSERKQLMIKLIEERRKNSQLINIITNNKMKIAEMIEGLEEESKRSLQMEEDIEKFQSEFNQDKGQLLDQLNQSKQLNLEYSHEIDRLRREVEMIRGNKLPLNAAAADLAQGVRSSLVTVSTVTGITTKPNHNSTGQESEPSPNVSNVVPVAAKTNAARPVSPKPPVPAPPAVLTTSHEPKAPIVFSNTNTIKHVPLHHISSNSSSTSLDSQSSIGSGKQPPPVVPVKPSAASINSVLSAAAGTPPVMASSDSAKLNQLEKSVSSAGEITIMPSSKAPVMKRLSGSGFSTSAGGTSRGIPPPVPPNKPVLPTTILKERSKVIQAASSASGGGIPVGLNSLIKSNPLVQAAQQQQQLMSTPSATSATEGEDNSNFIRNGPPGKLVRSCIEIQLTPPTAIQGLASTSMTIEGVNSGHNVIHSMNQKNAQLANNNSQSEANQSQELGHHKDVDMMFQELDDFQKMLVSMVNNQSQFQ